MYVKNKGIDIENIVLTGHFDIKMKFLGGGAHCEMGHSFQLVTPENAQRCEFRMCKNEF